MTNPAIHGKLYRLLHELCDELAKSPGYEQDASELRVLVMDGFERLDAELRANKTIVEAEIVKSYLRTCLQVQEIVLLSRAESD